MPRAFVLLLVAVLSGCAAEDRPSFLLYVVDTLRADALGCYGGPKTENVSGYMPLTAIHLKKINKER